MLHFIATFFFFNETQHCKKFSEQDFLKSMICKLNIQSLTTQFYNLQRFYGYKF